MAGDWIKMRTNLDTDPAVVRISSGLKTDRYSVVGRLHKIWSWANEHLTDGQDVPVDAEFLDSLVETPGFSAALRSVGWLTGRDGSLCFPNFERHNGASAKARAQDSARKKNARQSSDRCPENVRLPTGQKADQRREEKRRDTLKQKGEGFEELISEHLQDDRFAKSLGEFVAMSGRSHAWTPDSITVQAWLVELSRWGLDDAIAAIEFSKAKGAKTPILNGDHRRKQSGGGGVRGGVSLESAFG